MATIKNEYKKQQHNGKKETECEEQQPNILYMNSKICVSQWMV